VEVLEDMLAVMQVRIHMTTVRVVDMVRRHVMGVVLRLMMLRVMLMSRMLVRAVRTVMTLRVMGLEMTVMFVMTVLRHFNLLINDENLSFCPSIRSRRHE